MNKSSYLSLDGNQLRLMLVIEKTGSLTSAAKVLNLNQSTVSYQLDTLRKKLGDKLFVRSGSGVVATEKAKSIFPIAKQIVAQMNSLENIHRYDPSSDRGVFRIAASQMERDAIFRPLLKYSLENAPNLRLAIELIGSPFEAYRRLRDNDIDCLLVPRDYFEGGNCMQTTVLSFENAVFFDPSHPLKEGDFDGYCRRPHVRISFGPQSGYPVEDRIQDAGGGRHVALEVGDFDTAFSLISGSPLVATLPALMSVRCPNLETIPPPYESPEMFLHLFWHKRHQDSLRHKYWRDQIIACSRAATSVAL